MNGLAGLVEMKRKRPSTPVGIMSALATPENVIGAIDAGAAAFIPKTMGAKPMLAALRLVLAGERYVPADLLKAAQESGARARETQARPAMTPEEARILELLKQGKANKEIGRLLGIEEYTVKYHVRGIFRKLGAKNRTQAVKIALDQGK
jgi:two-component system nitrate/nitrite response regulator NarL